MSSIVRSKIFWFLIVAVSPCVATGAWILVLEPRSLPSRVSADAPPSDLPRRWRYEAPIASVQSCLGTFGRYGRGRVFTRGPSRYSVTVRDYPGEPEPSLLRSEPVRIYRIDGRIASSMAQYEVRLIGEGSATEAVVTSESYSLNIWRRRPGPHGGNFWGNWFGYDVPSPGIDEYRILRSLGACLGEAQGPPRLLPEPVRVR